GLCKVQPSARSRYRNQTEASPASHVFIVLRGYSRDIVSDAFATPLGLEPSWQAHSENKKHSRCPRDKDRGRPMGAIAKNPITQLLPVSAPAVPWLVVNELATAMRIMGPQEVRQLSQFAAVIVLVPESAAYSKDDPIRRAGKNSLPETSEVSRLFELI